MVPLRISVPCLPQALSTGSPGCLSHGPAVLLELEPQSNGVFVSHASPGLQKSRLIARHGFPIINNHSCVQCPGLWISVKPCVPASLRVLQPSIHRSLSPAITANTKSTCVLWLALARLAERLDPVKPIVVAVWDLCIDAKLFPVISEVLKAFVPLRRRWQRPAGRGELWFKVFESHLLLESKIKGGKRDCLGRTFGFSQALLGASHEASRSKMACVVSWLICDNPALSCLDVNPPSG